MAGKGGANSKIYGITDQLQIHLSCLKLNLHLNIPLTSQNTEFMLGLKHENEVMLGISKPEERKLSG